MYWSRFIISCTGNSDPTLLKLKLFNAPHLLWGLFYLLFDVTWFYTFFYAPSHKARMLASEKNWHSSQKNTFSGWPKSNLYTVYG